MSAYSRGAGARRVRVHVHLDWGRSPEKWSALYEAGAVIDADPYGYRALEHWVDLSYSVDHAEASGTRYLRRGAKYVLGFDLVHAWRNLSSMRSTDYVITHTEYEHLAVLALLAVRRERRVGVICQSVWLWDRWRRYGRVRRALVGALLRRGTVHTVHSPANLRVAQTVVGPDRARLVPFGIGLLDPVPRRDTSATSTTTRILAVGNDRDRDWTVLREAVDRMPDAEVRVRSRRRSARRITGPRIEVAVNHTVEQYRRDLAWCDVVVIPLRENAHASGVTVLLEAVSAGRPVVAADTGGLDFYANSWVTLYRPGQARSLVEAIDVAVAAPPTSVSGRSAIEAGGFTAADYALRHVLIVAGIEDDGRVVEVSGPRPLAAPSAPILVSARSVRRPQ